MCGIAMAVVSQNATKKQLRLARRDFAETLKTMDHRGGDAWGVSWTHRPYQLSTTTGKGLFKDSGHVLPMFKPGMLIIGHTRFATRGEKTLQNAHPFRHLDGAWAHNGSYSFPLQKEGPHESCDSYYLTAQIAEACNTWKNKRLSHGGYGTVIGIEANTQTAYVWTSSGARVFYGMAWGTLVASSPVMSGIRFGVKLPDIHNEELCMVLPTEVAQTGVAVTLAEGYASGFSQWARQRSTPIAYSRGSWHEAAKEETSKVIVVDNPDNGLVKSDGITRGYWRKCLACDSVYDSEDTFVCGACAVQEANG